MRAQSRRLATKAFVLVGLVFVAHPVVAANIVINNVDPPGVGFNDPTPVTPVGGNPGATLGEQRMIVFETAALLWGATIESDIDIVVQATFRPLPCDPTSGVLGGALALQVLAFPVPAPPGARPLTWYHVALANKLAGEDLTPGPPDPGFLQPPFADDVLAQFNGDIGVNPGCLTGLDWYYGLDNADASDEIDLLSVVVHEMAHGLGFSEFVNESTGAFLFDLPDIYSTKVFDNTLGRTWDRMADAGRRFSQTNTGNLVWAGEVVTWAARFVLGPRPTVGLYSPFRLPLTHEAQAAAFGPPLSGGFGEIALVALADDGVGVGSDACEPVTSQVFGKIALIDRGGCGFTEKVKNAQDAGARGAIIANDVPKGLPPMGGVDPSILIPSVGITQQDGLAIKGALARRPLVIGRLYLDPRFRAGADPRGQVRLYAPDPVEPGSSKSHWDTSATPNLLMEPFINDDLETADTLDLTPALFVDIGWTLGP